MSELKTYPPSRDFVSHANVQGIDAYRSLYEHAQKEPAAFWSDLASKELSWFKPFTQTLEWNPPFAKWFSGGKINASYNCLDRHLTECAPQQGRHYFRGRARRCPSHCVPRTASPCQPFRYGSETARLQTG